MKLAGTSGPMAASRVACASGFSRRHSAPMRSRSASVRSNGSAAVPVARMMPSSAGSLPRTSRIFATWRSVSQKTNRAPESARMY